MTRIFHIADTHIGYSAYRRMDEATGLNQREVDTYAAFKQFVDFAVVEKPEVIVHAGDLFDSVRPTNRAISFVLGQLIRLSEAGIPFVVISGNHETPRLKETGSVFSLFEHIPGIHVVYGNKYELVEIGDLKVHAIPHCDDIEGEKQKMRLNRDSTGGVNIALLHAGVYGAGKQMFLMDEFNEQLITIHDLTNFDYLALGHYHKYIRVRDNAYYAGSTERFSFNEVNETKGFLEVRLDGDGEKEIVFHELRTREMVDLEPVVCTNLDAQEIKRAITDRIQECNPEDKVVRLKVLDIPMQVYHSLDFDELKRLTRSAVHFEIKYEFKRDNELRAAEQPSFRSLHTEYEHFMEKYTIGAHIDKKRLKELGLQYMQAWESESEE
ncbi:MAG: exonuclease SbcCD subunit D [Methanosarcinales archaeon]|nr:exonuclease SbcCD subunit D [Methanosarcinales archaeon]